MTEKIKRVGRLNSLLILIAGLWFSGGGIVFAGAGLEFFIQEQSTMAKLCGSGIFGSISSLIFLVFGAVGVLFGALLISMGVGGVILNPEMKEKTPGKKEKEPLSSKILFGATLLPVAGAAWLIWQFTKSKELQENAVIALMVLTYLGVLGLIIKGVVGSTRKEIVLGLLLFLSGIIGCYWQLQAVQEGQFYFISRGFLPIPLIVPFAIPAIIGLGLLIKGGVRH